MLPVFLSKSPEHRRAYEAYFFNPKETFARGSRDIKKDPDTLKLVEVAASHLKPIIITAYNTRMRAIHHDAVFTYKNEPIGTLGGVKIIHHGLQEGRDYPRT